MLQVVVWLRAGVSSTLLVSDRHDIGYSYAISALCLVQLVFSLKVFWSHGGRQITAAGVVSIAQAAFVAYAGLWWVAADGASISYGFYSTVLGSYVAHVVMWGVFWRGSWSPPSPESSRSGVARATALSWCLWVGLGLVAGAAAVAAARGINIYLSSTAFAGVLLVTLGLTARQTFHGGFRPGQYVVLAVVLAAYVRFVFTGYGRLTVVALALGVVVLVSPHVKGRLVKVLVVVGAPVVTTALTFLRQGVVETKYGASAVRQSQSEPDSIVTPLRSMARLIESGYGGMGQGDNLLSVLTLWIPRSIWPDKPPGFGEVLTSMLEPHLLGVGHTMAGLMSGEWYLDFGWVGLAMMIPVIGLAVRWTDQWFGRRLMASVVSRRNCWWLVVVVIVIAGLPDLVWNGGSTYVSRTTFRLIPLVILFPFASREQPARSAPENVDELVGSSR